MGAPIRITREFIFSAMQNEDVQERLGVIARRIQARAEQIADREGVKLGSWVKQDVRPKGRPQAVVYADNVAQEFGTATVNRRRILGRAAMEAK